MLHFSAVVVLLLGALSGETYGKSYFITPAQTYGSKIGDSVNMDCDVLSLGSTVITWYKGDRIISAGNLQILEDPRIKVHFKDGQGVQISIRNVNIDDQGTYSCEVNIKDNPIKLTHQLEILVPPVINSINGGRTSIRVKQGSKVSLNCTASGHPKPTIHWERKHRGYFPSGKTMESGALLTLSSINHIYAGTYICVANNNVTLPVKSEVRVEVMYLPEVKVESRWVYTGNNQKAVLACNVNSNPEPEVDWYKGSMKLSDGERHTIRKIGNRYIITILNITLEDFGNYSCQAQNKIGRTSKEQTIITLTGSPSKPIITSLPNGQSRYSFHLQWKVNTHYSILRHNIYIWPLSNNDPSDPDDSSNKPGLESARKIVRLRETIFGASHPKEGSSMNNPHNATLSFENNLKGLSPATRYRIQVKTENNIGWSPLSDIFELTTSHIENLPKELSSKIEDEDIIPVGVLNAHSSTSNSSSSSTLPISSVSIKAASLCLSILITLMTQRSRVYLSAPPEHIPWN